MDNKKAALSIQFNWILILIAGAVILLFFFGIVQWQKSSSQSKTDALVLSNMQVILSSSAITESSSNLIKLPANTELVIDSNSYSVGSLQKQIKSHPIFSPNLIKGSKLLTYSLSWKVPFKVNNFLYLATPQIRYVLFYDDASPISENLLLDINKSLPPEFINSFGKPELAMNREIKKIANTNVGDNNNYKVKFIFINTAQQNNVLTNLTSMPDLDVSAINISGNSQMGSINFLQKSGNTFIDKGKTYYLGIESLIGAIFSENIEMYNASMKKAFKHLDIISQIYGNRSAILSDHYDNNGNTNCQSAHNNAKSCLDSIHQNSQNICNIGLSEEIIEDIIVQIHKLRDINEKTQLYSCALVY